MDIATGNSRFTTTVQIPMKLREEIKAAGMTINGALIAGWAAMRDRKTENSEVSEVRANMEKYRSAWLRTNDRVRELEKEIKRLGGGYDDPEDV